MIQLGHGDATGRNARGTSVVKITVNAYVR